MSKKKKGGGGNSSSEPVKKSTEEGGNKTNSGCEKSQGESQVKGKLSKKFKSQRKKSGKKSGKKVGMKPVTVAKIPSSREDSSSNWKALLQKQGKSLPVVPVVSARVAESSNANSPSRSKPANENDDTEKVSDSKDQRSRTLSTDKSRSKSQSRGSSQGSVRSETGSTLSTEDVQLLSETRSTSESEHVSRSTNKKSKALPTTRVMKKPPPGGLNDFGFFDYTHYGLLRTPITPAHQEFIVDSGIVAMDCEMVGVGPMKESALGRVSIVNVYGYCLYDKFVKPKVEVTDYRTQFSGIREQDLRDAAPFSVVAKEVADILRSHILVGHSLKSDLSVLFLNHAKARIRDTALYFKKVLHCKTPKLKTLVIKLLNVEIQKGEHSSITDAQATMALYRLYQTDWEKSIRQKNRGINILKETLDEFKRIRKTATTTTPVA